MTRRPWIFGALVAALAGLGLDPAAAVVFRHDRTDADALAAGVPFTAVGRALPDGGCTLIAPRWAVTAAHVAASLRPGSAVTFGDRTYTVARVIVHPEGVAKAGVPPEVDLALIELAEPVQDVAPLPLYRGQAEQGATMTIVGYGDFGTPAGPLSRADGRRRAVTNVVHDAGPRRLFLRFDQPPSGLPLEGVGGPGDSGGPVLIDVGGAWHLAGVSSASMDGRPGQYGVVDVYTRVGAYAAWIDATIAATPAPRARGASPERRYLYVVSPGIRNYVEHGGIGILVFDVDAGYRFVRRIPTFDVAPGSAPENVKGVAAHAATGRIYVSTPLRVAAFDLMTDRVVWNRQLPGGADRLAISPDGRLLYVPTFEGPFWHVLDAATGAGIARVETNSGAHNTMYGPSGRHAYLAGLKSPLLRVADTATHTVTKEVGPFGGNVRPFTINAAETRCFVNVNDLLGFEVGDLTTGKVLHRVEVKGYQKGKVKRHGCPSHGIGLTPDEREIWLTDGANNALHVFDATASPPAQLATIPLRDQPGWITFSMDGRHAYPSTGEIVDTATRKIVATLTDETGRAVQSEKLVEIVFAGGRPVRAGDQFGIGRASGTASAGR
jgi:DNA-binding beta-propeller fold protein YncE